MSRIIITKKHCPWCGTEIGRIKGALVMTYYCRNYQCWFPSYSKQTKLAKDLTS